MEEATRPVYHSSEHSAIRSNHLESDTVKPVDFDGIGNAIYMLSSKPLKLKELFLNHLFCDRTELHVRRRYRKQNNNFATPVITRIHGNNIVIFTQRQNSNIEDESWYFVGNL